MRRIISLWLPRFATDRISRKIPALRDKPFVLVQEHQARLCLSALNNAANQAGLKPHMTLANARTILPSVIIHSASPTADEKMLGQLASWCGRYSPWTSIGTENDPGLALEGAGSAGIWLDVTGCTHLFGGEEAMLTDMVTRVEKIGFTTRLAIADTLGCAWAVARFSSYDTWKIVPPGEAQTALSPLAIAALRLPPDTVLALHEVGLRYVGDLLDIPRRSLAARFKKEVRLRLDTALGKTAEPLSPILPKVPLIARLSFAEPIGHRDDIAAATSKLLKDLCVTLEQAGQGARRLMLAVYRPDGSTARITIGTARANREPYHLLHLFTEHLEKIDPEFGIDEMTLVAVTAEPMTANQTNLQRGAESHTTDSYNSVIDRLTNRLGNRNIRYTQFRESHIPERAAGFIIVGKKNSIQPKQSHTNTPRPLRLLRPPEEVDAVAKSADGPPVLFRWRRVLHHITKCEGPERITPEWWRSDNESIRDYYRVENETGQRFWLYRDEEISWFIHGLFG
ncbi:MAG: Y-family DNA polymerase [Alphaproteobacteria bacterium]